MKKFILSLFWLLIYLSSFAQTDWLCVYPDKKTYFENTDKVVYCIRIDSTFNDNTILYPFSDLHEIDWNCYSITSGSWLSKYIVLDDSGNTFFVNGNEQQICIKSQAVLNETWDVFENEKIKVKGEITSIDERDVLGVKDSVKTISFSVYDLFDMPVKHNFNQVSIEVSKNFGLVRTVSFYFFGHTTHNDYNLPDEFNLIGIDKPQLGFQNMNLREQYFDFQAGDELHIWDISGAYWDHRSQKIIHRYLSRNDYEDRIVYHYERKIYSEIRMNGSVDISTAIDTIKQEIIKGLFFNTEPNELYDYLSKVMIVNNPLPEMYMFSYDLYYDEDCFIPIIVDGCGSSCSTYYVGLGGPYCSYCEMFSHMIAYELVYYKKGDTEWGTPFDFEVSIPDYKKDTSFSIYPNPANNYITIKSANNEVAENNVIEIFDITGRIRHTETKLAASLQDKAAKIDISHLPAGIYFVRIDGEKVKFIKN